MATISINYVVVFAVSMALGILFMATPKLNFVRRFGRNFWRYTGFLGVVLSIVLMIIAVTQTANSFAKTFENTAAPSTPPKIENLIQKTDDNKASMEDLMSALATSVAAITLVLTLGSTWFAAKQRELQKLVDRQKQTAQEWVKLKALQNHLVKARLELLENVQDRSVLPNEAAMYAIRFGALLEGLQTNDLASRKDCLTELQGFYRSDPNPFPMADEYTRECQKYHELCGRDSKWCMVFGSTERRLAKPTEF